jgi:hypothetical protein
MLKRKHRDRITNPNPFGADGLLKDKAVYRANMYTMDAKPTMLDASLHRPGYRLATGDRNLKARQAS